MSNKNLEFRAVYFDRSELIKDADKPFDTIGIYERTSEGLLEHIYDMPKDEFDALTEKIKTLV